MAKRKSFSQGIDAILGGSQASTAVAEDEPVAAEELTPEPAPEPDTEPAKLVSKVTIRLEDELLDTVRALAFWERKTMTEVFSEALATHFKSLGEEHIEMALNSHKK